MTTSTRLLRGAEGLHGEVRHLPAHLRLRCGRRRHDGRARAEDDGEDQLQPCPWPWSAPSIWRRSRPPRAPCAPPRRRGTGRLCCRLGRGRCLCCRSRAGGVDPGRRRQPASHGPDGARCCRPSGSSGVPSAPRTTTAAMAVEGASAGAAGSAAALVTMPLDTVKTRLQDRSRGVLRPRHPGSVTRPTSRRWSWLHYVNTYYTYHSLFTHIWSN